MIHFYIGDDDDDDDEPEFQEVEEIVLSQMVNLLREDLGKRRRMWLSLLTVELMWHYSLFDYCRAWGRRTTIQHKNQATRCARKSYPHRRCEKC